MTWLKICGTTNLRDAQLSVAAGADALGFIFAPSARRIDISSATRIIASLRGQAEAIGVFVNEPPERVGEIVRQTGLSGVQLHGDEPAEALSDFRSILGNRKLIKVLHAESVLQNPRKLNGYLSACESLDAILLDSGLPLKRGGTGTAFSWNDALPIAREISARVPLVVAGGLNPNNVREAIELFAPWGVDVVSGVESEPGVKGENKLKEFTVAVRQTAASARQRE
jgi:phosphoribosylanthranilate isomerase